MQCPGHDEIKWTKACQMLSLCPAQYMQNNGDPAFDLQLTRKILDFKFLTNNDILDLCSRSLPLATELASRPCSCHISPNKQDPPLLACSYPANLVDQHVMHHPPPSHPSAEKVNFVLVGTRKHQLDSSITPTLHHLTSTKGHSLPAMLPHPLISEILILVHAE